MFQLTPAQLAALIALSAAAGWVLRKNAWRAGVWLFPSSVVVEDDAPADAKVRIPLNLEPLVKVLDGLGFKFIGTHVEQPRFGAATLSFDYASSEGRAFASLFLNEEEEPRAEYLTPIAGGGFVRTANYRRSALEEKGYFSGYLENIPLERVLHAHQRTVATTGQVVEAWDTRARLDAARAWYKSPAAARELRQMHQQGLMWTFGAVVSVGLAVVTLVG
jgi:hypothetical protein